MKPDPATVLFDQLDYLQLPSIKANYSELAAEAARLNWDHQEYLRRLIEGEYLLRHEKSVQRRIRAARFPVIKTLDQFVWDWPKKLNRLQVQNLFRLEFISQKANVILLGTTGIGKTHLATALGYAACLEGSSVLFADAIGVINDLSAAQQAGNLKRAIKHYLLPRVLVLDELGYLAVNQHGADLLFQVISQRYERGSIILTSNKPFKDWPSIFANDSTITSAVLDRLLHHAEVVLIQGRSYRMKDQPET
jgi:DNA replication protein DnaC